MLFHANSSNLVDSPLHFAKKQTTKTYNFKNDVNMYLPLYRNHNRYRRLPLHVSSADLDRVDFIFIFFWNGEKKHHFTFTLQKNVYL